MRRVAAGTVILSASAAQATEEQPKVGEVTGAVNVEHWSYDPVTNAYTVPYTPEESAPLRPFDYGAWRARRRAGD
jgi:hypothetical protein